MYIFQGNIAMRTKIISLKYMQLSNKPKILIVPSFSSDIEYKFNINSCVIFNKIFWKLVMKNDNVDPCISTFYDIGNCLRTLSNDLKYVLY